MSNIESFKNFVKTKPELAYYVNENKTTWQKLYETYDLYGENSDVWNNVIKNNDSINNLSIKNIISALGNIDAESFQKNINSIQKAIGFALELTGDRKSKKEKKIKKAQSYKTVDKFYSD